MGHHIQADGGGENDQQHRRRLKRPAEQALAEPASSREPAGIGNHRGNGGAGGHDVRSKRNAVPVQVAGDDQIGREDSRESEPNRGQPDGGPPPHRPVPHEQGRPEQDDQRPERHVREDARHIDEGGRGESPDVGRVDQERDEAGAGDRAQRQGSHVVYHGPARSAGG